MHGRLENARRPEREDVMKQIDMIAAVVVAVHVIDAVIPPAER